LLAGGIAWKAEATTWRSGTLNLPGVTKNYSPIEKAGCWGWGRCPPGFRWRADRTAAGAGPASSPAASFDYLRGRRFAGGLVSVSGGLGTALALAIPRNFHKAPTRLGANHGEPAARQGIRFIGEAAHDEPALCSLRLRTRRGLAQAARGRARVLDRGARDLARPVPRSLRRRSQHRALMPGDNRAE
jgi:hypothetical protein